jgi:hypothetical protein
MVTAIVIAAATRTGVDEIDHPAVRIGVNPQHERP